MMTDGKTAMITFDQSVQVSLFSNAFWWVKKGLIYGNRGKQPPESLLTGSRR